jgi:hypothetical protein
LLAIKGTCKLAIALLATKFLSFQHAAPKDMLMVQSQAEKKVRRILQI